MKPVLRFPVQRSIGYVVAVYAVVIVLVILWAAQLLGTVTGDNPGQTPALLILSLVFPAALLVISVFNFARVIAQRRAGVPGSRLRLRLIGTFALTVAVTALPLGILSGLFLKTAIGTWLAPGNGIALEAGERLAQDYHRQSLDRIGVLADSEYLSDVLADDTAEIDDIWAALRDVSPDLGAIQVLGLEGNMRMGDPDLFLSASELAEFPMEGPLPRKIRKGGTVISWQRLLGDRIVILSSRLSPQFESDARRISLALDEWRRYDRLQGTVGGSLALFGLYLSGPLVMMALLIGMALSERVIRPLITLGEATRKIAEGDFSFRVLAPREDELVFLTQSFNRMIRELEASRSKLVQTEHVAAWQVIAQRLAHELRNPLTPIKLSAQRIQRKALRGHLDNDMVSKAVELILREVDGLDKLLQDFREFAGGGPPKISTLSLRPILEETLDRFRTVNPSVEWILVDGSDDITVPADALQIRQVLVNILKNAMEAGSTRVTVRVDPVRRGTTPYVRLQIRDDGEGIEPDRVATVFQPYDSSRDRGSGLGLAVVQRILYDHRGRIWFESEPGSGTVFYVDLPIGEGT
ncbi:MAG: ATP-binding protein [Spirochaetaceae bacterium]|nr:ATP-binding protein [Spirochaetaceae bacterium]